MDIDYRLLRRASWSGLVRLASFFGLPNIPRKNTKEHHRSLAKRLEKLLKD